MSASARRRRSDLGVVEQHAAGALHQRLDDDARDLVAMLLGQQGDRASRSRLVSRQVDDHLLRGITPANSSCMPSSGSQHRHRAERCRRDSRRGRRRTVLRPARRD